MDTIEERNKRIEELEDEINRLRQENDKELDESMAHRIGKYYKEDDYKYIHVIERIETEYKCYSVEITFNNYFIEDYEDYFTGSYLDQLEEVTKEQVEDEVKKTTWKYIDERLNME